jgi:hypothetical protein
VSTESSFMRKPLADVHKGSRNIPGNTRFPWGVLPLGALTLASRFLFTSAPYYVDGPRHVYFIEHGTLFTTSAPGYLLFAETVKILSQVMSLSVPVAISLLNISFSTAGAIIFAQVASRLFPGRLGILLSFCYAFSDIVWFVSDIHSTYAAMTFFVPALLYAIWVNETVWAVALLWALMTGFRPSDGVFILPFVVFAIGKSTQRIAVFIGVALPVVALWYIPSAKHFGGSLLSPLTASGVQAHHLANGLFATEPWRRKLANLVHIAFGSFNAWSILSPFVFIGCLSRTVWIRSAVLFIVPGLLFFSLYFFSDCTYFAYLVAPGFLLAGEGLQRLRPNTAVIVASCTLLLSIAQMTIARPFQSQKVAAAVINSYCLKYSGWAIRNQYAPRLHDTLETLHEPEDSHSSGYTIHAVPLHLSTPPPTPSH